VEEVGLWEVLGGCVGKMEEEEMCLLGAVLPRWRGFNESGGLKRKTNMNHALVATKQGFFHS
jgi:hypothetical protein